MRTGSRRYVASSPVPASTSGLWPSRTGAAASPADRATPLAVTQILRYWIRQPGFDRWRTSLPILGVDGSLASNATESPARGKVFAKTGTAAGGDPLNGAIQVQAKALAGYLERPDGSWLVFDVVVNNGGSSPDLSSVLTAAEDVAEIGAT